MLENLRRKSLVKTYNDLIYQVHFEQGLARYENHVEIDVCNQKLSKELQKVSPKKLKESSFKKTIDMISKESFSFFKLNMIFCPSGTFTMGHEAYYEDNPPRLETIEKPFLLGETEVTQELYEKVMGNNPSNFQKRPKNPVENVSWEGAIKFCNELSRLQGLELCYTENPKSLDYGWDCDFNKNGYRLPEEKEWEYAAKAGTENRWAGTNDENELGKYAWFGEEWGSGSTHLVKTKKPNEWGFYDMSGNVFEWCWDKYNTNTNTNTRSKASSRIDRGGCWGTIHPFSLHSAYRYHNLPSDRYGDLGFRVCRSIVN